MPEAYAGRGTAGLLGADRPAPLARRLGARVIRMNVPWAAVAGAAPRDPPDWRRYDEAVDRARAGGLQVQLTLTGPAPGWATASGRRGTLRPDPKAYGRFAGAAAGHFHRRVVRFSIWNEPNWHSSLRPTRTAAAQYRRLYRAGYRAIKRADPAAPVLFGELAPMARPEAAISPLRFLRAVTCRDRRLRPVRPCAPLRADGFAHHPYTLRWSPGYPGPGRDDVTTGSLSRLTRVLDALARRRALRGPRNRPLGIYLTEWGYHADSRRLREPVRSRYIVEGLARMRAHRRVRQVIWYQLAGPPPARERIWDTALLDADGRRRPAFAAVRSFFRRRGATRPG
ncbi:MAG TPA: hypothetical protein VF533_18405, partial [Solirubrobacteraceae bacterium]|jgi:hypothetical protein